MSNLLTSYSVLLDASNGSDRGAIYGLASSRRLSRLMFSGISLAAWRRTMCGTSSFPIPWPAKSSSIVSRDRDLSASGSTVTATMALLGPSMPRSAHRCGGSYSVISVVTSRSRPPILRMVVHLEPTRVVDASVWPLTAPCCHSGMVQGARTLLPAAEGFRAGGA